jgi:hypothetical protein
MVIFRALFWLTAVALLLPRETAEGRAQALEALGMVPVASFMADENVLAGFQSVALATLYRLKTERAEYRRILSGSHPES